MILLGILANKSPGHEALAAQQTHSHIAGLFVIMVPSQSALVAHNAFYFYFYRSPSVRSSGPVTCV